MFRKHRKRDRGIKFIDYALHGISEYWIIDPDKKTIEQYIVNNASNFDLYTINNVLVVDKVYKFEELENALVELNQKFNLESEIVLPSKKTKGNSRNDKRHYRDIISQKEAALLSKIFAREIAFFNYTF